MQRLRGSTFLTFLALATALASFHLLLTQGSEPFVKNAP